MRQAMRSIAVPLRRTGIPVTPSTRSDQRCTNRKRGACRIVTSSWLATRGRSGYRSAMRIIVALLLLIATPACAADARFIASLARLDPRTRLEQICDYEAMRRIGDAANAFHPDRAKSDVVSPPRHHGDTLVADGAAFRSGGHWYQVAFTCKASPDRTRGLSFSSTIGALIPEAKWPGYGLWK
jgi:hypothetical protein